MSPSPSPSIRAHDCDMNTHLAAKEKGGRRRRNSSQAKKVVRASERVGVGVTLRGAGIFGTTAVAALLAVHYDLSLLSLNRVG